jgi:hypothetical protein
MFCLSDFLAHTGKPDSLNAGGFHFPNRHLQIIQDGKRPNSFCSKTEQSGFGNMRKCRHEKNQDKNCSV